MAYEATDLFEAIRTGIEDFSGNPIREEHREEVPHPEYLTTSAIAFSLAAEGQSSPGNRFTVKCEDLTSKVWNLSLLTSLFKRKKTLRAIKRRKARIKQRQRDSSERKGNIDITLYNAHELPFALIETKGKLTFTAENQLYAGSRKEFIKDLKRNAEYLTRTGGIWGIQYGAFTFYLKDATSVLKSEGASFQQKMTSYFEDLVKGMELHRSIRTHVHIATFDDGLYNTHQEAMEGDEHGAPAQEMYPAWHTLYGIISLYRVGDKISDNRQLAPPAA
jgi:hypothetical protein